MQRKKEEEENEGDGEKKRVLQRGIALINHRAHSMMFSPSSFSTCGLQDKILHFQIGGPESWGFLSTFNADTTILPLSSGW